MQNKCKNCKTSNYDLEYFQLNDREQLCESCYEDYQRYMDENERELAAQDRHENFLAEY